ncbi:unnamed protein product [Strongylus vulgaris]|uniref:Uncharacterized protein n=1 Tax=Strongylus vulgaris TaxID=40348 RepID=A0A3P7KQU8_STRVU|nr:unnamed protein product [Strongylus vulgaris]
MKGVTDGGIKVPHSKKRFFGYDPIAEKYDAEAHRDRIFGKHVAEYMQFLEKEDKNAYRKQFSCFIANGINANNLEEVKMYKQAHTLIREHPDRPTKSVNPVEKKRQAYLCY